MNVKIMGADQSATNLSSTTYLPTLQASLRRSRLYKLTISPLAAGTDCWVWIYDSDGTNSAGIVAVRYVPGGLADTWDFGSDGSLFQLGILAIVATAAPTSGASSPTPMANNTVILKADIRIG